MAKRGKPETGISKNVLIALLGAGVVFLAGAVAGLLLSGRQGTEAPASRAALEIPQQLSGLPPEWASPAVTSGQPGYSLLMELSGDRVFLLERCHELSYVNPKTGRPAQARGDFCKLLLKGTIVGVDAEVLHVASQDGGVTELRFGIESRNGVPQLRISWEGSSFLLAPGSRNDLLQRFESLDSVKKAKERLLRSIAG